jgi:carboxylate-amine ligase
MPAPASTAQDFTLGVEEEYQIIDPKTRRLRPRVLQVLPQAQAALGENVQPEFQASQIEMATPVCRTLAEVREQVVRARRVILNAAARDGDKIGAAGTHPFSNSAAQPVTPKERYQSMAEQYRHLAHELVIFGCHVHVGLPDPDAGVAVMNLARHWLAPLLALSANSPFWEGEDTGYASYRTELWVRWPMAGPPLPFASRTEHDALVQSLVATGSISDATKIYWDIRLPEKTPTVEFRVADVCLRVDEAVLLAGLVRALARTCFDQAQRDEPFEPARPELLRAAHWRAARYGLEGDLIDVAAQRAVPAADLIQSLLLFARPALEEAGDWDEVSALTTETLRGGNGAMRQRAVFAETNRVEAVVDYIVEETARGTEGSSAGD